MDVDVEGPSATIDTVAVHPDHRRAGLGTALLERARAHCRTHGVTTLDAWTRDDDAALGWYRSAGFAESEHYLHVYADLYTATSEPELAIERARSNLRPIRLFLHGQLDDEVALRQQFRRVHTCRRFTRSL